MDVFTVRQPVEGDTERAAALLRNIFDRVGEDEAMRIIDREGVWTESAFLERTDDGDFVRYYFEAEDAERVEEVFEDEMAATDDEALLEFQELLGEPERVDEELLYHVVHPERPRT